MSYYILLSLGTAGMFACLCARRKRFSLNVAQAAVFTLLLTLVGVAGAMLLYWLETGEFGGVSFFGSLFLIPLLMPLVGLLFWLKPGQTLDICGPCVAVMIGCMRFNCVLNGCCGGWQVCLGNLCFSWPTQALDSIGDFAILIWLLQLEKRGEKQNLLYPLLLIAYSVMRFLLEFLRDTAKDWLCMSHGQWFALVAIALSVLWIVLAKRKEAKA